VSKSLGRDEILGALEEILGSDLSGWGWGSIKRGLRSSITAPLKAVKYSFTVPYKAARAAYTGRPETDASSFTRFSGAHVGDEERALAAEGGQCERDALARRTSSGYNSHWRYSRSLGDAASDQLEELRERAAAGDVRAQRRLEELRRAAAKISGNAPVVDGLPHPTPLTAEQKEDIRTYLRHLPPLAKSQEADYQRMTSQLLTKFGAVGERARKGDPAALKKWGELVSWVNKLQDGALANDANSLTHLRNISRTNLFSSRVRVAS
jgi:hypothetical protein